MRHIGHMSRIYICMYVRYSQNVQRKPQVKVERRGQKNNNIPTI